MSFNLTPAQVQQVELLAAQAATDGTSYWRVYEYVANQMFAGGVPATDPAYLWFRGATEANAGRGAFSALIRSYTETQYQLRYGSLPTNMQAASNAVAQAVISEVRGLTPGSTRGLVPSVTTIGERDAVAVGNVLFARDANDTAFVQNAAWSGTVLMSLLGADQAFRLMSSSSGSPTAVDTVNDWRDVLFAYEAYRKGLIAAGVAFASGTPAQRAVDLTVLGSTIVSYSTTPGQQFLDLWTTLPVTTNSALRQSFQQIDKHGRIAVLDWLRSAVVGRPATLSTSANFDANAKAFADTLGTQGQQWSAAFQPYATLLRDALGTGASALAARNALQALTPFAVAGASLSLETRGLDLDPTLSGVGLTTAYLTDRAAMLGWTVKKAATGVSSVLTGEPISANAEFLDVASGREVLIGGVPSTYRRRIIFGSDTQADTIAGYGLDDRLYGAGGNDILSGLGGRDYIEGGTGNDTIDGGAGHDLIIGGNGIDDLFGGDNDDHLIGGADSDQRLEGGIGRDYLEGGAGIDNYHLSTSDTAVDTIFDVGNQGRLFVDGTPISGFTCVRPGLYESTGGLYRMAVLGDGSTSSTATLYRKSDGRTLANIVGIQGPTVLDYTLPPPPVAASFDQSYIRTADSDLLRLWFMDSDVLSQIHVDEDPYGTDEREEQADGGALNDWIEGGTFALTELRGGTGNDVLVDLKITTPSQEALQTTRLIGGAGSDFLYGRGGTLYLDGGADNDFISSARFDSAPIFASYRRNGSGGLDEFLTTTPAIMADMGSRLSLTSVDVSGAIGSYDTTLARWEFYYRPFAAGVVAAAGNLHGEAGAPYSLAMRNDGTAVYLGAPGVAPPLSLPVTQYTASWTTGLNDPLRAADVIVRRSDGGTLNMLIAQVRSATVPTATMARDGTDNSTELAFINAGDGNDIVFGGAGKDIVDGGIGADRIDGAGGEDFIDGGAGDDFVVGGRFNDVLAGGDNADILHGAGESDSLYGGAGDDILQGDFYLASYNDYGFVTSYSEYEPSGDDILDGGDGNDVLDGGGGQNVLFGGAGNDTLFGRFGADVMRGGAGDDTLIGNNFTLLVDGGEGNDTYVFDSQVNVVCTNIGEVDGLPDTSLADYSGNDTVRTNFFRTDLPGSIENLRLDGFAVTAGSINLGQYIGWGYDARAKYRGNDLDNVVDASNVGQQGFFINHFLGGVLIDGGAGADTMSGSNASDTYIVDNTSDVVIEAYVGSDSVDRIVTPFAITLSANIEEAELSGIDSIAATGNALNNLLIASTNTSANVLSGLTGNDTYRIGANDSVVESGGQGTDTVEIDGEIYSDLRGQTFDLSNYANVENLKIYKGSMGGVTLRGNAADNVLHGSAGSGNVIDGGGGNDTLLDFDQTQYWDRLFQQYLVTVPQNWDHRLLGGAGNDTISSMGGNDVLDGGTGNDLLEARVSGSRTVVFGAGYGIDTLTFISVTGTQTLSWTAATDFSSLRSQRVGNNLRLTLNGGADRLELVNYYSPDPAQRAEFHQWAVSEQLTLSRSVIDAFLLTGAPETASATANFLTTTSAGGTINAGAGDDVVLGAAGVDILSGEAGADSIAGGLGNDTLSGGDGADRLDGGGGNDQLTGGLGNDEITAGAGNDVIHFSLGSGQDRIKNNLVQTVDGLDVLRFDASIRPSDVTVSSNNVEALVISVLGGDQVTVNGSQRDGANALISQGFSWTSGDTRSTLDRIEFSDGTVWTHADLLSRASVRLGTPGNDILITPLGFSMRIEGLAGNDILTGRDGNDTLIGGTGSDQLIGGDGNDTLDSGADGGILQGETGSDVLIGGTGRDRLDGGTGADSMTGGAGDDIYVVDDAADTIIELASGGTDTVSSYIDYVLPDLLEDLWLLGDQGRRGEGNSGANSISGTAHDDILIGGAGVDRLDGGYGGNDLYVGAGDGDTFVTNFGRGTVTVDNVAAASSALGTLEFADFSLLPGDLIVTRGTGAQADDLLIDFRGAVGHVIIKSHFTLTGGQRRNGISSLRFGDGNTLDRAAIDLMVGVAPANGADLSANFLPGTDGNDFLYGTSVGERIYGLAGADWLNGFGGADTLAGGTGDDSYTVDHVNDYVYEAPNSGNDWLYPSINYALPNNVENIALQGSTDLDAVGTATVNFLYGNTGNNRLTAGDGNDYLDGGAGNDQMFGEAGDDQLFGRDGADVVDGGAGLDYIHGDAGNDTLYGGDGNDTLTGGTGDDAHAGGTGDDLYAVDAAGDVVTELVGEGTDTVYSPIAWVLGANLENLTLTGTSAISGTGNSLNNVITGNSAANVLSGGAGNDTYVVTTGDVTTEAAGEGTDIVQSSISWTLGANVESLTLTGAAAINGYGNTLANTLIGNSAVNRLDGGAGADAMQGGAGNDTYVIDNTADVITEAANAGTDVVEASASYTLGANIENIVLTGTAAINATGNVSNNTLTGNSGGNRLSGGGGTDTMIGGAGNDTYVVDGTTDVVTEGASAGTDTIESSITYTLGANVENLTLTGTAAINATGNTLANVLTGNSGLNLLNGGTGADTMAGGAGNDIYVVDNIADVVTEAASAGTDRIDSSVTFTLGANVENLTLTGTAASNATGNTLNNALTGNTGANRLDGGAGNDTMAGGTGDDVYVVDIATDVVTEAASAGIDRVESLITYTLGANVENLVLAGTTAINATGNTLANTLTGNAAANVLNGGTGADTMSGGLGDDIYVVDNVADVVTEAASAGIDRIDTSITTTLGANVENLTLTGTTAINGTGNTLNNVITGNSGANVLNGGAGNDTLTDSGGANVFIGGAGTDTLNVTSTGIDRIAMARGHGIDSVIGTGTAANDVLEVSNGITKSVMGLIKTGNDLIVDLGASETITLKNWYATTSVRNVGTLKIIGDASWVPGQTGTPTQVETLNMASLVTAFDAWRAANPTLTRWPLDSFAGGSFAAISDMRFGVSDEDHINPLARTVNGSGSKLALLGTEPTGALRTVAVDDGASPLVTLAPPHSPNLASAESAMVMQPNLKSFMKFWTRQVPVAVPPADWYGVPSEIESAVTLATAEASAIAGDMVPGAPRAISAAGGSKIRFADDADGWAHALPVARMPMPADTLGSEELARMQPEARSAPWWESDSAGALSSLIAGTVERRAASTMPLEWESVHSELMNQLTHTPQSALGEQMPHDGWATAGSSPVLSEGVDLRRLTAAEDPQRAAGRVIQALR